MEHSSKITTRAQIELASAVVHHLADLLGFHRAGVRSWLPSPVRNAEIAEVALPTSLLVTLESGKRLRVYVVEVP